MKSLGPSRPDTVLAASAKRSSQVGSSPLPSGRWAANRRGSSSPARSSVPIASRISRASPATRSINRVTIDS